MKWTQAQPIPSTIWTAAQLAYHQRIDADIAALTDEQTYILDLQAAAVEFAEEAMGSSLLNRPITATYYDRSLPFFFGFSNGRDFYDDDLSKLRLPRGPIVSITSVTDANGTIDPAGYALEAVGTRDQLRMKVGWKPPLTVVYVAGYGSTAAAVPADIRHAIRAHFSSLYEQRESVSERTVLPVPQSLADFYRQKSRNTGIG